ncbi:hypothetical protein BKI52_00080 [marine bacterium AO1-C]|nr:hypothetical protein BKI52_00080 [marine bacterium AO1-C]
MKTTLPLLTIFMVGAFLLNSCSNQSNKEHTTENDSTHTNPITEVKPKTIRDYFQQLKAQNYFQVAKDSKIKLDTLDIANGFMQVSYNDAEAEILIKATLVFWNKRKSGKDLVGILFRQCTTNCTFKDPVFLEFEGDHYQNVSSIHYPNNLKAYLKRRLTDYTKTCKGASPFNAALLPQQGTDIQLVIMSHGNYGNPPCPQALIGVLKYTGEGFTFIEPVGN